MPTKFHLRLLCVNDVYKPERFALLKTMKTKYAGKGVTKCVLPGDFVGGSQFSYKSTGESMIRVCNAVGFDYVTLGNHGMDKIALIVCVLRTCIRI
jgi:hypothetical protein